MATSMLRMMPLLLAGSFLLLGPESTFAQRKKGLTRFAADMVTLKSGERLRGALLGEQPDGTVSMAVQRKWLEKNEAEMYRTVTETEAQAAARQSTQLRDRLRRWIDEQADANTLVAFLETELDRVDEQVDRLNDRPGGGLGTQFVMLSLPKNRLDFWFAQPPENRRVAGLAWSERLADVETREVGDLIEELKSKRIDPERDTFRLTDRVPGRAQSDREWAARQAIVEFE